MSAASAVVTIDARPGWEGRDEGARVYLRGRTDREAVRGAAWELAARGFEHEAVWVLAMLPGARSYRAPYIGVSVSLDDRWADEGVCGVVA